MMTDLESQNLELGKADEPEHHTLENIDHDSFMWHGREAAVEHARRHTASSEGVEQGSGQGTVMGVIFPCTANILGVLLFLRLPWIVGKAGILQGFALVFVCCTCTFITSLSLSAVATNGKILGGGSYYIISRSLGPAIGAGVGLCFYMANSIGAAMYFMGTVEAWEIAQPNAQIMDLGTTNNIRVTAFCLLAGALLFVAGGVKFVSRLGTVFLFIVFLVILCMYIGCFANGPSAEHFSDNLGAAFQEEQKAFPGDTTQHGFISLMALWFPAVTGIMAGSNRSADLKDPASSIPKGTLTAQLSTSVVYLSFVLLFGSVASRQELLNDPFFAATFAWPIKEVVMYGVMASTIGAGLTSLVSGTRLLSAIAADHTLPILSIFAAQPGKEPRLALVASGVLCSCAIAIGQLNSVAPVLTMFFLMCYTCVNLSCAVQKAVEDPNWRPSFRYYHWSVSLLGAVLCVWMMFAINWLYAIAAVCFCLLVFAYATHNSHQVKWGDGFQGLKFQLAKNFLMKIDTATHTKNWRPQILVMTAATLHSGEQHEKKLTLEDPELLDFVSQLKGGRGITIVGAVCEDSRSSFGQGSPFVSTGSQQQRGTIGQEALEAMLHEHHIKGFSQLVHTKNMKDGISCLAQSAGLGAFQANCVLAAWPQNWEDQKQGPMLQSKFIHTVQTVVELQKVMLVAKGGSLFPDLQTRLTGTIDIWWIVADGGILLLLPFLLKKHRVWQSCSTRLFVLTQQDDADRVKHELERFLNDFRLDVEVHVKVVDDTIISAVSFVASSIAVESPIGAIAHTDSAPEVPRLASPEPFAAWRRQPAEAEVLEPPREASSGFLPSRHRSAAFPEMPPGNLQTTSLSLAPPQRDSSTASATNEAALAAAQQANPTLPVAPDSCPTISDERDIIIPRTSFSPAVTKDKTAGNPIEQEEFELASGLNQLIQSESASAELVVTNLPDMPPGGSVPGYFALVDELTKGLRRSLLARGTASEVITAFT